MKYKHLFGPVPSRRLGISLGVDLVPAKVCSQDCIYCEVGKTTNLTLERQEYVNFLEIKKELQSFLSSAPELDYITFSGSGEPTLNCKMGELSQWLKDKYPQYKLACITNSSLMWDKGVQRELSLVDLLLPSLDAVSEEVFLQLNRPADGLKASMIVAGLAEFSKLYNSQIWLEIFLSPGINDTDTELQKLKSACQKIMADKIQLNTLDRPGILPGLKPLSNTRLKEICDFFAPLPVEIIAKAQLREHTKSYNQDIDDAIIELIKRRPCTDEDLCQILGLHINELNKYLGTLLALGKISKREAERGTFFEVC